MDKTWLYSALLAKFYYIVTLKITMTTALSYLPLKTSLTMTMTILIDKTPVTLDYDFDYIQWPFRYDLPYDDHDHDQPLPWPWPWPWHYLTTPLSDLPGMTSLTTTLSPIRIFVLSAISAIALWIRPRTWETSTYILQYILEKILYKFMARLHIDLSVTLRILMNTKTGS